MKYAPPPGGQESVLARVRRHGPRRAAGLALTHIRADAARRATRAWRDVAGRVLARQRAPEFSFAGERYGYVRHRHNATWRNERAVELAIISRAVALAGAEPVLEVGNVLQHYFPHRHEVVDKYERGPGVRNVDIVEFSSARPYGLIVSISTLEHIGFDDEDRDPGKAALTVAHLRTLLAPGGRALITAPLGYNPHLDAEMAHEALGFDLQRYLVRTAMTRWREAGLGDVLGSSYGAPWPGANGLLIGYLEGG